MRERVRLSASLSSTATSFSSVPAHPEADQARSFPSVLLGYRSPWPALQFLIAAVAIAVEKSDPEDCHQPNAFRFVGSPISCKPDHSEADQYGVSLVAAQQLNW
jgi:hypothetical protein